MKRQTLLLICLMISFISFSQENRIEYNGEKDDTDIGVFMAMVGFDYHKFEMKSEKPAYINVYVDEYLNDKLIKHFDHISANKDETPKAYFDLVFTKLGSAKFTMKIYTLSKNDSIEKIQFRIGELGLFKNLQVNKSKFDYSWKRGDFNGNIGPKIEIGKKIPLLFYATAVSENVDGQTVNAFCNVPNILLNRDEIENQGKIEHFFEIGIVLVEKIE
ncbi:hypothetical protein [Mangrovivirga cuniculi]|nr:hypothetical protein [Mangrovivirga cuniculi]